MVNLLEDVLQVANTKHATTEGQGPAAVLHLLAGLLNTRAQAWLSQIFSHDIARRCDGST
jgi:hypothetical protein